MVLQYNQDARVNGGHCVFLLEERGGDKTGNKADTLTTAVIVTVRYRHCYKESSKVCTSDNLETDKACKIAT